MTCHQYEEALSEYADGTLQASEHPADSARLVALEAHLAGCARCQAILADLHTLRVAARGLERHTPPPQVWAGIQARLQDHRSNVAFAFRRKESAGKVASTFRRKELALAAAVVIAILGASWMLWQRIAPAPTPAVAVAPPDQGPAPDPELVQDVQTELKLAEEHYVRAIVGLEAIAKAEGSALDPQTAQALQSNLTVIDAAIGESRAALQSEPANRVAQESLFVALSSKVRLLQNTIALINEMRKDNQEGAARIVSGLDQ